MNASQFPHEVSREDAEAARGDSLAVLPRAVAELLNRGDRELAQAQRAEQSADMFVGAHVAALRYAGAAIASVAPGPRATRGKSAWQILEACEPGLAQWARHFAGGAPTRAAIEAGDLRAVSPAVAEGWRRAAEHFSRDVTRVVLARAQATVAGPPLAAMAS